jgi:hypothetical protein
MSACEPLVEICPPLGAAGWIWFRCAYAGCHPGVGHIIIESQTGEILYDGCPTEGTRKLVWLDFKADKLWGGGLMQVNYGLPGCSGAGHVCNRATFEWGSSEDTSTPLGVAYLDNAGGGNDMGNVCDGAALSVWRTIAQGNVPNTPYLESAPPWGYDLPGYGVGGSNLPDHILGPYGDDRWIFTGNIGADDDLMIDGVRVFADGLANQVGGGNVFLKFLPRGRVARINVWNSGGWTGASGALRLYSSGGGSGGGNLTRCNAFIIPPQTIGAYKFKDQYSLGTRKVFYRKGGLPDPVPCPDVSIVPTGYVPKVSRVSGVLRSGPSGWVVKPLLFSLNPVGVNQNGIWAVPPQVPLAKRTKVGASEHWEIYLGEPGPAVYSDAQFAVVLFFPSVGFQGGMVEIGVALSGWSQAGYDGGDYYTTEVVRVGEGATLRIPMGSQAPYAYFPSVQLDLQVDVAYIPV